MGALGFVIEMKREVSARIQQMIDAVAFRRARPEAIFRILLTAVHGAAAMRLCDRMEQGEDADALARDTLEAALQGSRGAVPEGTSEPHVSLPKRNDRHDSYVPTSPPGGFHDPRSRLRCVQRREDERCHALGTGGNRRSGSHPPE